MRDFEDDELDSDVPELHDYVDAYLARSRSGEGHGIDAYLAELAASGASVDMAALREALDGALVLESMRATRLEAAEKSGSSPSAGPEGKLLESGDVLGDYRIVREVGSGGMGIVYEAEQQSLGRRVALKVLTRSALRDPKQVKRFEREARLAAGLHHTNIVPVFGSGEYEGRRYYVMQLIAGRGLDQAMQDGRFVPPGLERASTTTWKEIAGIGLQVAEALAYAHSHGTLHRDIKPANLLYDAEGVVRIVDFGLARALEDPALTQSGDVVGTLRYMAPEQLRGACDERSDLYALGLTLYELATGASAFGPSRDGLLERVRTSSLPRPSTRTSAIPRDLETILMTCVAREAQHRYPSAPALESDLRLFLEDRPIQARRASSVELAWRWAKRNRLMAAACAIAVLALTGAALVGWTAYGTTRTALAETRMANERAKANHALGRSALDAIFARVAGADPNVANVDDEDVFVRDASFVRESEVVLLEELLRYYDRFGDLNVEDDASRAETARAYHRVGRIQLSLRKQEAATAAFEKSLALYGTSRDNARVRIERARCHNDLGIARAAFRMSRRRGWPDRRQRPGRASPQRERPDPEDEARRAAARESFSQRLAQARVEHEAALALVEDASEAGARLEVARALDQLGMLTRGRGRPQGRRDAQGANPASARPSEERVSFHERALAILEALRQEDPKSASYRLACARVHTNLSRAVDEIEAARGHWNSALEILEELCAEEAAAPHHFYTLVETRLEAVLRVGGGRGRRGRRGRIVEDIDDALDATWRDAVRMMRSAPPTPAMIQLFLSTLFRIDAPELHGFESARLFMMLVRAWRTTPDRSRTDRLALYEVAAEHLAPVTRAIGADAPWIASFYAELAKIYLDAKRKGDALRVVDRARRCLELARVEDNDRLPKIRATFDELERLATAR